MTALAQTTSPATAEAEKALRARAEQFYQLEVDGQFRKAEALVAEDTKDYYFDHGKPSMRAFKMGKIEFTDPTHANVTLTATVVMTAPMIGSQEIPMTSVHTWKLENGTWFWYVDQTAGFDTPFGKMRVNGVAAPGSLNIGPMGAATGPKGLESLVTVNRNSVELTKSDPVQSVIVTNGLPGPISLTLSGNDADGLTVNVELKELKAGEKGQVQFKRTGKPVSATIIIHVAPVNLDLPIQVKSE